MPRAKKTAPKFPLQWHTSIIHGVRWKTCLTLKEFTPELGDDEGRCDFETCTIYVKATLPEDRLQDIDWHEHKHATNYLVGLNKVLESKIKRDYDVYEVEEEIVLISAAIEMDTLRRNNLVKWWPLPKELPSLLKTV